MVGLPPTLDQHLGLQQGVEHLTGQELVLQPVVSRADVISLDELDNTTTDSVRGTCGDGAVSGATSYGAGVVGNAFAFDRDTYISAPLVGGALSQMSVSLWVKINAFDCWSTILKNWGSAQPGAFH